MAGRTCGCAPSRLLVRRSTGNESGVESWRRRRGEATHTHRREGGTGGGKGVEVTDDCRLLAAPCPSASLRRGRSTGDMPHACACTREVSTLENFEPTPGREGMGTGRTHARARTRALVPIYCRPRGGLGASSRRASRARRLLSTTRRAWRIVEEGTEGSSSSRYLKNCCAGLPEELVRLRQGVQYRARAAGGAGERRF